MGFYDNEFKLSEGNFQDKHNCVDYSPENRILQSLDLIKRTIVPSDNHLMTTNRGAVDFWLNQMWSEITYGMQTITLGCRKGSSLRQLVLEER